MIVYKAVNKLNRKTYVGQTVNTLKNRKKSHIRDAIRRNSNTYFHRAIRKYGPENFEWSVLRKCKSKEHLNLSECYFIGYYDAIGIYNNSGIYNIAPGGMGSFRGADHTLHKSYKITSPDGEIHIVHGLRDFCRRNKQHKIYHNYLSQCAMGKISHHKGWKCQYLKDTEDA